MLGVIVLLGSRILGGHALNEDLVVAIGKMPRNIQQRIAQLPLIVERPLVESMAMAMAREIVNEIVTDDAG
ncbi:hypothetical protein F4780DRAFT_754650 [Xylariomycetidae sp. FL0641]|nr:hypothetical protein F4780DRAFT_754650 [Xylariomycetidae sp. FL0641]